MRSRWVIPVVAAVLAVVTAIVIVRFLQELRPPAAVLPVRTEAVVFAKVDVGERTVAGANVLEVRQIPFTAVHPKAARRIEDVAGRVAVAPIFADEQVLLNKLAPAGVNGGLAYVIPKDKRAMTIAVNEVIGVAGFVFPGDRVDIVATVNANHVNLSKIVLQDIPVLAVAQNIEQKPGERPHVTTSATLTVTPEQVEALTQIDNNGRVRLALRPSGVTDQVETTGKTLEAALSRGFPQVGIYAAAGPAPQAPPVGRALRTAASGFSSPGYTVELWRATEKTIVRF